MSEQSLLILAKEALTLTSNKGLFLTTQQQKLNTMIISWGHAGIMWQKPIFIAPVRESRFTHEQLSVGAEFTASAVPDVGMEEAFKICGSKSGRDIDKFETCGLKTKAGRVTKVPVIDGCPIHIECRVLCVAEMDLNSLDTMAKEKWYRDDDPHTLYFGEILACYKD